jgi:predicted nucleic-acid-binding Zn-ribbon protein
MDNQPPKDMSFTPERAKEVIDALESRGAKRDCPRCGYHQFNLEPGYFVQIIQKSPTNIELGGSGIASAIITCQRCGYIMQHAIGALGLLPKRQEGE